MSSDTASAQLAERVIREPDGVDTLLPILGFALRSLRAPERRASLASLSRVAFQRPALKDALSRALRGGGTGLGRLIALRGVLHFAADTPWDIPLSKTRRLSPST